MAEQMTFTVSRDGEQWRARWDGVPGRSLAADTRAEVEQACREYVAGYTGRPASETTIFFVDAHVPKGTLARLESAEAAIAQVREVCADQCFWAEHGPDAGLVNAVTVESILDALEGDSDE